MKNYYDGLWEDTPGVIDQITTDDNPMELYFGKQYLETFMTEIRLTPEDFQVPRATSVHWYSLLVRRKYYKEIRHLICDAYPVCVVVDPNRSLLKDLKPDIVTKLNALFTDNLMILPLCFVPRRKEHKLELKLRGIRLWKYVNSYLWKMDAPYMKIVDIFIHGADTTSTLRGAPLDMLLDVIGQPNNWVEQAIQKKHYLDNTVELVALQSGLEGPCF